MCELTDVLLWNQTKCVLVTSGNSYNNDGTWTLSNTIVSVNNGVITALQEGNAIVVAIDDDGNKEFFFIKVI